MVTLMALFPVSLWQVSSQQAAEQFSKWQQSRTMELWRCSLPPVGTNPRIGIWWPAQVLERSQSRGHATCPWQTQNESNLPWSTFNILAYLKTSGSSYFYIIFHIFPYFSIDFRVFPYISIYFLYSVAIWGHSIPFSNAKAQSGQLLSKPQWGAEQNQTSVLMGTSQLVPSKLSQLVWQANWLVAMTQQPGISSHFHIFDNSSQERTKGCVPRANICKH